MASDKFGNNPVTPLYNATGRNPRDLDMGSVGKPLGSVGNSGAGGKDFGISNKPAQTQPLGQNIMSPFNVWGPNSMYQTAMGRRRNSGRGGQGSTNNDSGDPEGTVYDAEGRRVAVDAMERTKPNYTINFAKQTAGDDNSQDNSVGKGATVSDEGMISGTDSVRGDQYKKNKLTSTIESGPEPAKTTRAPRTEEQKAATKAKREAKKAENPNYGKRNPNRPPRTPKPARNKPTRNIEQTQSIGNLKQTAAVGGNI